MLQLKNNNSLPYLVQEFRFNLVVFSDICLHIERTATRVNPCQGFYPFFSFQTLCTEEVLLQKQMKFL